MPEQGKGEKGDLGKPLDGQKRDRAKRLALNKGEKGKEGTGEMGSAIRSSSTRVKGEYHHLLESAEKHAQEHGHTYITAGDLENFRPSMVEFFAQHIASGLVKLTPGCYAAWMGFERACMDLFECNQRTPELSKLGKEVAEVVKGQEGDLGKPLAGQKRKQLALNEGDKGKEKMQGAGEMVVGCMATRSSSRRAKVKGQEVDLGKPLSGQKLDQAKRLALNEGEKGKEKMQGAGETVVVRTATRPLPTRAKEVCQNPMSSSESDASLYKMFKDWASTVGKSYETDVEENKRFKIWCSKKEWIDNANASLKPGGVPYRFNFFSDLTRSEYGQYYGRCSMLDDPYNGNEQTPEFYESKLGKEVAKAEMAFDKWVAEHNRKYDSKWKRAEGFAAYFDNNKRIKALRKENPGRYLNYPHDLDILMDRVLDDKKLKSLLNGCSQ